MIKGEYKMIIQISKRYGGPFPFHYLKERGYNLFFCFGGNNFAAIKTRNGKEDVEVEPVITVCSDRKIPEWKQLLTLQTTGHLETHKSEISAMYTRKLSEKEMKSRRFFIYDIVG